MSDKDNKQIDKLFQLGSEQYDFEYNDAAWEQMESLLDKDARKRGFIWWFLGGIATLLLLGGLWLYPETVVTNDQLPSSYTMDKEEALPSFEKKLNSSVTETETNEQLFKNTKTPVTASASPDSEENEKIQEAIKQPTNGVEKSAISPTIKGEEKEGQEKMAKTTMVVASIVPEKTTPQKEDEKATLSQVNDDFNKELALDEGRRKVNLPIQQSEEKSASNVSSSTKIKTLPLAFLETKPKKPTFLILEGDRTLDREPLVQNTLLLGVVLAGELTAVGIDNISQPDIKAGIQIEYRYKHKYSTGIGVNYIRKKYQAGSGEYIPPVGFWTRAIAPQSTKGVCNILEIPVMAAYYFKGSAQTGLYTQAALTSYLILRERYDYFYDLPDPDLRRHWATNDLSEHWLGIGQLSIGHQKVYPNGLSRQLAAYVQTPLTGIGHGQVKMWSIGTRLVVNFKL